MFHGKKKPIDDNTSHDLVSDARQNDFGEKPPPYKRSRAPKVTSSLCPYACWAIVEAPLPLALDVSGFGAHSASSKDVDGLASAIGERRDSSCESCVDHKSFW